MSNETALATSEKKSTLAGQTFSDLELLGEAMRRAAKNANLIAPMVALDHIPIFHEVSLRVVTIDAREMKDGGEVYYMQGAFGLGKTALAKLSMAARIAWDPVLSERLDDGSDPYYCFFRAVGYWPDFDGRTLLPISDHKQLDLRDGSPMLEKLRSESKEAEKAERNIRQMRAFILEHAESKAKNRAIRQALAIKSKYTAEDLKRPFVVPALVETGRCDDPELRRLYIEKRLEGKGLATRALFGVGMPALKPGDAEPIEVPAREIPRPTVAKQPPPPVGTEYVDEETGEVTEQPQDPFQSDFSDDEKPF